MSFYCFYFGYRIGYIEEDIIPGVDSQDRDKMVFWVIMNSMVICQGVMKFLYLLRVFEKFGLLVNLIIQVVIDVIFFGIFFFSWIVLLGFLFRIAGIEVDSEDYPHVHEIIYFLFQLVRNSIGDLAVPVYTYWTDQKGTSTTSELTSFLMVLYCWSLWLANIFFMLITLLNFLIAIIT